MSIYFTPILKMCTNNLLSMKTVKVLFFAYSGNVEAEKGVVRGQSI